MKNVNHNMTYLFIGLIAFISAFSVSAETEQQPLSINFAVVPQQAASKLATKWIPLLKYIEKEIGIKVHFRTAKDIPTFEQRLLEGQYDFAYMNPYHYIVLNQRAGYQAIAKARDKKLRGILVSRNDSNITSLKDINGHTVAFPAPAAFAATLIAQSVLRKEKLDFDHKYVSSHDSVYRAVAAGLYPVGGGVMRTFKSVDHTVRGKLKIIWTSVGTTPHAIAHHPRIEQNIVEAVTNALLSFEKAPESLVTLNGLKVKGFSKARNSDWNDIRAMGIKIPVGHN